MVKKYGVFIVCVLSISLLVCGCGSRDSGITNSERKVHGMSASSYLSVVAGTIGTIYCPSSAEEFEKATQQIKQYANDYVSAKFSSVSPDFKYEKYNSKIVWNEKLIGDGKYQPDGADRIFLDFDVVRNYKHWLVKLELELDGKGTIVEYRVYK